MCLSAYDADAVAVGCIFLEECFAYAGGGSNDDDVLLVHFFAVLFSHPLVSLPKAVHAVGVLCIMYDVVACVGI